MIQPVKRKLDATQVKEIDISIVPSGGSAPAAKRSKKHEYPSAKT